MKLKKIIYSLALVLLVAVVAFKANASSLVSRNVEAGGGQPKTAMKISVSDGSHSILFELNETSAAMSLYDMLPLSVEVSNYSNNEKIFYPPTPVACGDDCIEGACPAGTLALFSPWGNVVMYYVAATSYPGLYILGSAVEGADDIVNLSGTITVKKVYDSSSDVLGDVNNDGIIDVEDVNAVINIILKK